MVTVNLFAIILVLWKGFKKRFNWKIKSLEKNRVDMEPRLTCKIGLNVLISTSMFLLVQKKIDWESVEHNRDSESVVFNSGQKMALRAFYFIRALSKALTYYYTSRSQRHLLVAIENNRFGGPNSGWNSGWFIVMQCFRFILMTRYGYTQCACQVACSCIAGRSSHWSSMIFSHSKSLFAHKMLCN